jgi:hypothetical protein
MANAIKKYGICYHFLWQNFVENSKFRDLWQKYGKCHTIYMANAISFDGKCIANAMFFYSK